MFIRKLNEIELVESMTTGCQVYTVGEYVTFYCEDNNQISFYELEEFVNPKSMPVRVVPGGYAEL